MKNVFLILILIAGTAVGSRSQSPRLVIPIGHTEAVSMAKFSPDGKIVATTSNDNTVKLWDAFTGMLLADLTWEDTSRTVLGLYDMDLSFSPDGSLLLVTDGSMATVWYVPLAKMLASAEANCGAFSPDGLLIALGANGIKIFDLDFNARRSFKGYNSMLTTLSYSPDGSMIITGDEDGTARIWNSSNGRLLETLKGHNGGIHKAIFSPGGKRIVTLSDDEDIARVWETNTGKLLFTLPHNGWITSSCFSPDGAVIITTSVDSTAKAWDTGTGALLFTMQHNEDVNQAVFSPAGKSVRTISEDSTIKTWELATGKQLRTTKLTGGIQWISFSPDGNKMVIGTDDERAVVMNPVTDSVLVIIKGETTTVDKLSFIDGSNNLLVSSAGIARTWESLKPGPPAMMNMDTGPHSDMEASTDGRKLAIYSDDSTVIWNVETSKPISRIKGKFLSFRRNGSMIATRSGDSIMVWDVWTASLINTFVQRRPISTAAISPDGKKLVASSHGYEAMIWDIASGDSLIRLQHPIFVKRVAFSPTGNRILTVPFSGEAFLWDTSGNLVAKLEHGLMISSVNYSGDGRRIITASNDDNVIRIWDGSSGKLLRLIKGHEYGVQYAAFSPDGRKIVSHSSDNTIKIWDTYTGRPMYTYVSLGPDDYFFYVPSMYYMSSPAAARLLHYVTPDLRVITFDQLDIKYNRPDKVLAALGVKDSLLVTSYRKAYEKRIKKLGIDTTIFSDHYSIPAADFANREAIYFIQEKDALKLHITGSDTDFALDRFNVWVNEVPVFGLKGISLRHKQHDFDTVITITLSAGNNRIETSVTNVNGIESYRMPLFVQCKQAVSKKERVHFIGIGLDKFEDTLYNLRWSVKDIKDLSSKLKEKYPGIIIDTLFNTTATRQQILALKQKLLQLDENDKVIISYSGHGLLSKDLDYFLSTYNVNFSKPEENGLSYDELESLMDGIRPRKKLMLIDACHSGEVDKEELERMETSTKTLDSLGTKTDTGYRSSIRIKRSKLGMTNSFELMQALFANVSRGTGATIISAAGGTQYAQERGDLQNGVFTYSVIDALNNNVSLTVARLKKIVGDSVVKLTNGLQKPTSRNETNNYDWLVW